MRRNQATLARETQLTGRGLHLGVPATVFLRPAQPDAGARVVRIDLPGRPVVPVCAANMAEPCSRTRLSLGEATVDTTEHLFSALLAFGIDNVEILLDGPEVPAGDGSGLVFARMIRAAGVAQQAAARRTFAPAEPIMVADNGAVIELLPQEPGAAELQVEYELHYDESSLARGRVSMAITSESYEREIAPARTFCIKRDMERLLLAGLGKGATRENNIVIDGDKVIGTRLRFPDECARHKALDLLGDLYVLGQPVVARVRAVRSGHGLNRRLVRALARAAGAQQEVRWH